MVDTHAHLGLCEQPDAELVAAARAVGVRRMVTIGLDEGTNRAAIAAAEAHAEVWASVGRHPNSAAGFDQRAEADLEELAAHPRVVAIGETGLDFFRDRAPVEDQRRAFAAQIAVARRTGLPLVVHLRDRGGGEAVEEAFATLARDAQGVTVVLHCFSAPPARVGEAAERGWYCSFAGNVTYPKNEHLREAAAAVPLDRVLVETDSPFLAPQRLRGRDNAPSNVIDVIEAIALARDEPVEIVRETTAANARKAFPRLS